MDSYNLDARTKVQGSKTLPLEPHDAHRIWARETNHTAANARRIVVACCAAHDPHVESLDPADALEILQL